MEYSVHVQTFKYSTTEGASAQADKKLSILKGVLQARQKAFGEYSVEGYRDTKYVIKRAPKRVAEMDAEGWEDDNHFEAATSRTMIDQDDFSEDQPTGVLTPEGDMIYRMGRTIGFDLTRND